ncbi:hypothetical protein BC941DRAFT_342351 [Chlamydoabsidia padenii]|nr:hypothetical protein BC941DRAFT_342351 [Chlamydoabsidia padenii]
MNSSSVPSNTSILTDERLLEIVENLEDHWRSPPILTPTTLAVIFNNKYSDISSPFPPFRLTTTTEKVILYIKAKTTNIKSKMMRLPCRRDR